MEMAGDHVPAAAGQTSDIASGSRCHLCSGGRSTTWGVIHSWERCGSLACDPLISAQSEHSPQVEVDEAPLHGLLDEVEDPSVAGCAGAFGGGATQEEEVPQQIAPQHRLLLRFAMRHPGVEECGET